MEEEKTQVNLDESNFKVKFSRITTDADYQEYKECVCEVCFQNNNKYFPEGDEKGIKMMTCYGCRVKCHVYCYGIETQIVEETMKNKVDEKITYFLCQKCRIEPKKQVNCAICNTKKGALKQIENTEEWVHVTCGLFSEGLLNVENYKAMTFSKISDKPLEKDKKPKVACQICKSNVGIKKCFSEDCTEHAHVYCTMKSINDIGPQPEGEEKGWCIRMTYSSNPIFDITSTQNQNNATPSAILQSPATTTTTSTIAANPIKPNFADLLNEQLKEISAIIDPRLKEEIEAKALLMSQSKIASVAAAPAKKSARGGKSKQNTEETEQAETKSSSMDTEKPATSILQSIAAAIVQKFKDRQDMQTVPDSQQSQVVKKPKGKANKGSSQVSDVVVVTGSANQTNPLIGGEISLECQQHRRQDVYCVCQKIDCSDDSMVSCDLCNDWYHYSCVKFDGEQRETSNYRCLMCDEWYAHKKRRLLKEYASGKAETFEIMVSNVPKLNLMDFISVMLFVDTRIHNMLFTAKKSNIDNQIKDAISTLSFIPLISSKISDILIFKSRKFIVEAVNEFLEAVVQQTSFLRIQSAVAISDSNNEGFMVIEENQKSNEATKKIIDDITSLFTVNKMKEKGVLMSLKKQINWITKAHSSYFRKNTDKVSSTLLNDLLKEEDEVIQKWTEFTVIDTTLQQSRVWQTKICALYESTIQKATQSMEIEEQVSTSAGEKQEISEEDYITRKYQLWRERIQIKPTIEELDALIYEGRESIIDNVQELKKLEQEKEEIAIWAQQLEEQERNATGMLNQKLRNDEKVAKTEAKQIAVAVVSTPIDAAGTTEQLEIEGDQTQEQLEQEKENKEGAIELEGELGEIEGQAEKQEDPKPAQQDGGEKQLQQQQPPLLDLQSRIYKNSVLMVKGDFEIFAMQMMTKIVPQIPRMNEIISMLEVYEKNELKWESISEYVNERKQAIAAAAVNGSLVSPSMNIVELVTEQEVHDIIESSLSLEMRVPFLSAVLALLNEIVEEKSKLQAVLNAPFDESSYVKAGSGFPVCFACSEQSTIAIRLAYFKEITEILESKFPLPLPEQLDEYVKIMNAAKFPQALVDAVAERVAAMTPITDGIKAIVASGVVEAKEIEQVKEYLNQMKLVKVNFRKEMDIIRIMQKSDKWLRNLHKIFYNTTVEFVNSEPVVSVMKEIDLEVEEELEAKSIAECVSEMKEKWQVFKSVFQLRTEFVNHVKEGMAIEFHYDSRIKAMLNLICDDVWTYQTESMLVLSQENPNYRLTFESIFQLCESALYFQINPENETLKKLNVMKEAAMKERQAEIEKINQLHLEACRQAQLQQQEAFERKMAEKPQLLESIDDDEDDEDDDEDDDDEDEDDDDDDEDDEEDDENDDDDDGEADENEDGVVQVDEEEEDEGNSSVRIYEEEDSENLEGLTDKQKKRVVELHQAGRSWNDKVSKFLEIIEKSSSRNKESEKDVTRMEIEDDENLISFPQLKSSLLEGYLLVWELLQIGRSVDFLKKRMCKLEGVIVSVHNYLLEVNTQREDVDSIDTNKKILNCIDVSQILIEFTVSLGANPSTRLSLKSLVKMPFKNLHAFKNTFSVKYDTSFFAKTDKDEHIVLETASVSKSASKKKQQQQQKKGSNSSSVSTNAAKSKEASASTKSKATKKNAKGSRAKEIIELESQDNNSESRQGVSLRQKSNRNKGKTMDADFVYGSSFVKQFSKEEASGLGQKTKLTGVGSGSGAGAKDGSNSTTLTTTTTTTALKSKGNSGKKEPNKKGGAKKGGANNSGEAAGTKAWQQSQNSRVNHPAASDDEVEEDEDDEEEDEYDSANLEQQQRKEVVTDDNRKTVQDDLRKVLASNAVFVKQGQNPFKNIENQMFGEYHKNRKVYLEKAAAYIKLFTNLNAYPLISKKIMVKNFQVNTLDKLTASKLEVLEKNLAIQQTQPAASAAAAPASLHSTVAAASKANSNTSHNLNSSKEPQPSKKIKTIDSFILPPPIASSANKPQNNMMSALSMLLTSKDSQKESSSTTATTTGSSSSTHSKREDHRKSGESSSHSSSHHHRNSSSKHDQPASSSSSSKHHSSGGNSSHHNNNNSSSHSHRDDSKKNNNQSGKYSSSSSHSRKRDQGHFSEESSSDEIRPKNHSKNDSKKLSNNLNSPSTQNDGPSKLRTNEGSVSKSQVNDSHKQGLTTPKQSMNKSDCEDIDEILNTYASDSKVYQLDNSVRNNQTSTGATAAAPAASATGAASQLLSLLNKDSDALNGNQDFLFNPDADGTEVQMDEEKKNLYELNKQYFDMEDEIQIAGSLIEDKADGGNSSNGGGGIGSSLVDYLNKKSKNLAEQESPLTSSSSNRIKDVKPNSNKATTTTAATGNAGEHAAANEQDSKQREKSSRVVDVPTPLDCVVRVCKCKLRLAKSAPTIPAALYTMDSVAHIKKFPQIDITKSFDLLNQSDFLSAKNYLEKQVSKSIIIILRGWVELINPKSDSKRVLDTINQQDLKEKVFGFKQNGMTFNFFTEHLISKTDFKIKPKVVDSDNQVILPVIIYLKKSEIQLDNIKTNPYKFVKFSLNPLNHQSKIEEKRKQIEQQQILSPIGSDIEDDDHNNNNYNNNKSSLHKKDAAIFEEKQSKYEGNHSNTPLADKIPKISLLELQDIDLQSLQLQLQDIPTSNPAPVDNKLAPGAAAAAAALPPFHILNASDPRYQAHYNSNHPGSQYNRGMPPQATPPPQYPGYQQGSQQQPYMHGAPHPHAPPPPPHLIGHHGGYQQQHHQPHPGQHPSQQQQPSYLHHHQQAQSYVPPPLLQPPPPGVLPAAAAAAPAQPLPPKEPGVEKGHSESKIQMNTSAAVEVKHDNDSTKKSDDAMDIEINFGNIDFENINFDFVTNLLETDPEPPAPSKPIADPTAVLPTTSMQQPPLYPPNDKQVGLPPASGLGPAPVAPLYLPRQPYPPPQNAQNIPPHYATAVTGVAVTAGAAATAATTLGKDDHHIGNPSYPAQQPPPNMPPYYSNYPGQKTGGAPQHQQAHHQPQWDASNSGHQNFPLRGAHPHSQTNQPAGQPPQKFYNYNVNPSRDVGLKGQQQSQQHPPQQIPTGSTGQNVPPQSWNSNSYAQGGQPQQQQQQQQQQQHQNRNYPFNPHHSAPPQQGAVAANQNGGYQDMRNAPRQYGHQPQYNQSMTSPPQGQQMSKYPPRAQNMQYNNQQGGMQQQPQQQQQQPIGGGPQNPNSKMNAPNNNKSHFGSRQQQHYQRNNQPYTAPNPVPFSDPSDDRSQHQQYQQPDQS